MVLLELRFLDLKAVLASWTLEEPSAVLSVIPVTFGRTRNHDGLTIFHRAGNVVAKYSVVVHLVEVAHSNARNV